MSIIIVALKGAPKVSESALAKEAELDARLEAKVKGSIYHIYFMSYEYTPYRMYII